MEKKHYNKKYFAWQSGVGSVGGVLNKFKFEKHVKPTDVLMDFGCGGGYLLNNFKNVPNRCGLEINPNAREQCKKFGLKVFGDISEVPDNYVDTLISNHAFEHVYDPYNILTQLYKKIKKGGQMVIVLPCEQPHENGFKYNDKDQNQHLYTWCPQTFGNLVKLSGFKIVSCTTFQHQWMPGYQKDYLNKNYHQRCRQHAVKNKNYQIKCIAKKV